MSKKLMILGGGIYQVPLILQGKKMGLETLVVSIKGDYPGIPLADHFLEIDTRDCEKILKAAQEYQIDGICTCGTDVAVRALGYVCEEMGLFGIGREAARRVTDKYEMKKAFRRGGVSTAKFHKVTSLNLAKEAALEIGYPVIVKAVDSSGSRGIQKAENSNELEEAYQAAMAVTSHSYVLIEDYIEAEEIGVDAYVGQGKLEAFFPHKKFNYKVEGTTIPVGHAFPFIMEEKTENRLRKEIEKAVKALGLSHCPLNADVFIKGDQVWIIEIGGRTGATCIPELISCYKGYNWYEKIIESALGEHPSFDSETRVPCSAKLIFSPKKERITAIDYEELKKMEEEGIRWALDVKEGDEIPSMKNGTDRIGHMIVPSPKEEKLDFQVSRLRKSIHLKKGNLEELWQEYQGQKLEKSKMEG